MKEAVACIVVAFLAIGCANNVEQAAPDPAPDCPHTSKAFGGGPEVFRFAVMADRTGAARPGVFEEAVEKLNLLQPDFVMTVGDMIEGQTYVLSDLQKMRAEFEAIVDRLEMPFFYVPGNHDISNSFMAKEWAWRYKRPYYHFVYRNVLFLCLNTEDSPNGSLGEAQIAYAADVLASNADVRWTFVFMHRPMWADAKFTEWKRIESLLAGRPHTVFAGHVHAYSMHEQNGGTYLTLATTGANSPLLGPELGMFDHIVWVTMTDAGPRIANLLFDGILDQRAQHPEVRAVDVGPAETR
ncbi:MAG TPA: metallophosphoesterase [Planctomycetota bacterium]|nr:metallophosphoesterase [Planctomycetota bacterium]